jgi:Flp pilus assembly protein TadD
LIWIKHWDFNWQGDYQYARPISLPKGARLVLHYTYDNSTNNVRNPNQPPKLVRHGSQTTDEMAGLVFQVVARNSADRMILAKNYYEYFVLVSMEYYRFLLGLNSADAEAHVKLGRALASQGNTAEALPHLRSAVALKPDSDQAHYELGFVYLKLKQLPEASEEFLTVIRLNPSDNQAFGNLGYICLQNHRFQEARVYFETALRLNPDDLVARGNLDRLKAVK